MDTSVIYTPDSMAETVTQNGNERIRIAIHVQAEVVPEKEAIQKASHWLLMNAGNLLRADNPELVLGNPLKWRLDVWLSTPALNPPRVGPSDRLGQIYIDASTGDVITSDSLIEELTTAADAIATN